MDAERIATEVADQVRELIVDAERRAAAIVAEAEAEASRIREQAEAEGQRRLTELRTALAELEQRLGPAAGGGATTAEVEPGPVTVPEPSPNPVPEPSPQPVPEPSPEPVPEPTPERIPEPTPPPDEGTPPDPAGSAAVNGDGHSKDAAAARLVAMNMALGGSPREEIAATLRADFELDDLDGLVDDALARAGR